MLSKSQLKRQKRREKLAKLKAAWLGRFRVSDSYCLVDDDVIRTRRYTKHQRIGHEISRVRKGKGVWAPFTNWLMEEIHLVNFELVIHLHFRSGWSSNTGTQEIVYVQLDQLGEEQFVTTNAPFDPTAIKRNPEAKLYFLGASQDDIVNFWLYYFPYDEVKPEDWAIVLTKLNKSFASRMAERLRVRSNSK